MNDLPNHEINNLLNQIAQGDDKAMTVLYKYYQRSLYAYVRLYAPDDSVAEEVVQEAFMAVNHQPLRFNSTSKFSTWLCTIAKRKAIDHWRKQSRQPVMQEIDDEVHEIADDKGNVEHFLLQEERDEILIECKNKLSIAHQEVVHLAYVEGASMHEIAEITLIPIGTVKSRLHHAMEKITQCVKRAYDGDLK